jgi:hypothetical protein
MTRHNPATVPPRPEHDEAMRRWMRRQRLKTPFRKVWHRVLRHELGRYACFTCDMDLP